MRSRKLVKLGSSLFVSIPAEWTRALGLREGSVVAVDMDEERVVIRPLSAAPRRASVSPPAAHRKLLAAYLNGCGEIEVSLSGMSREDLARLEEVTSSLVGLEKVYEDSGRVIYGCFVDDDQDPSAISGRIVETLSTMLVDAARALDSADREALGRVADRDSVIDKLYFLLVRVLRSTTELPRAKLMDFRAMSKVLERMGDEVSGLAAIAPGAWEPTSLEGRARELADLLVEAHAAFLAGGAERAEALGEAAWSLSCELHGESEAAAGFSSRAIHTYSVAAGLVKDVTDLVV
ncbi:MAG: AbrB/MazE/SpoVT family DNA-binding domain-containing protein [Conexivisphaera sp.]